MMFSTASVFDVMAADDSDRRVASRRALALAHTRVENQLGAFLRGAVTSEDFDARLAAVRDNFDAHVASACEETGHDKPEFITASLIDHFKVERRWQPRGAAILTPFDRESFHEKLAPGKEHMPGVGAKNNRMYEHIKETCLKAGKSEERCKEEAARTVNKYRSEHGETKDSKMSGFGDRPSPAVDFNGLVDRNQMTQPGAMVPQPEAAPKSYCGFCGGQTDPTTGACSSCGATTLQRPRTWEAHTAAGSYMFNPAVPEGRPDIRELSPARESCPQCGEDMAGEPSCPFCGHGAQSYGDPERSFDDWGGYQRPVAAVNPSEQGDNSNATVTCPECGGSKKTANGEPCPKCHGKGVVRNFGDSVLDHVAVVVKHAEYHYVKKQGDEWVIIQKGTGKVLSHHASQEEAEAAFRAMEAHKHGADQDNTGLSGPEPKMDKRKWTPQTVGNPDPGSRQHPNRVKDPLEPIVMTNDDQDGHELSEIGEQTTEKMDLADAASDYGSGFSTATPGGKAPGTKVFPMGDQTTPVTRDSGN